MATATSYQPDPSEDHDILADFTPTHEITHGLHKGRKVEIGERIKDSEYIYIRFDSGHHWSVPQTHLKPITE